MHILVVGVNHKTSDINVREKFYLQPIERELLMSDLKNNPKISESFVLSTCNRTEIYANAIEANPQILIEAIFKIKNLSLEEELVSHFYKLIDRDAVNHLLQVTTGIDSLIVGEKQILGQIKEAFEFSTSRQMMGKTFNILSNLVIQSGKKVRNETQIDRGGSSISWAAVVMAQKTLGTLEGKSVLILGSGKMGKLALQQLSNKGAKQIYIMNRTVEKAQELAKETGAIAVPFWDIKEILPQVDVCICSSSCTHYLIDKDLIERSMMNREARPMVCVDISVPRNIDPAVAGVNNVSLIEVDDLSRVVEDNINKRMDAVGQVEKIISDKLNEFYRILEKNKAIEALGLKQWSLLNK